MTLHVEPSRPISHTSASQVPLLALYGFAGVGLISMLAAGASGLKYAWRQYLRPAKDLSTYGKWAIVTGASGGIGRAYCDYLAKQGALLTIFQTHFATTSPRPDSTRSVKTMFRSVEFSSCAGLNICLISRSRSKLEQAAAEITTQHCVTTTCLAVDLEETGVQAMDGTLWTEIKQTVDAMDVGVLVNNAGSSHDPAHLHDIDPSAIDRIIAVNNLSVVKLTHLVLPGMVSRGRGAIVNVSTSFTTAIPAAPFLSLYTASKGFIDTFSKALSAEYTSLGIDVQVRPSLSSAELPHSSTLPVP